jgi:hypothetical protein
MVPSARVNVGQPLPTELVAGANIAIDPRKLYEIGKLALKTATERGSAFGGNPTQIWIGHSVRSAVISTLPEQIRDWHPAKYEYLLRHDHRIQWQWETDDLSVLARDTLEPAIMHFFKELTRVKILLQRPGVNLPAHRDITPGQTYDNMRYADRGILGDQQMVYRGPKWLNDIIPAIESTLHADQAYYALKVPLDIDNTVPRSYLLDMVDFVDDDYSSNKIYYDHGGQPYWLNEYSCLHGVDAGDEWRGVFFIDGILNMQAIKQSGLVPIKRIK